ncbi:hypothetical protein SELMODRAFT_420365 [Selaginella moellendorffii]|uniref:Amidohydrolase 3 domain-containing protein n=1 Tax=Selaginella moellendorffii TaxID=88036 RepID=D8SBR9_SELML|nr:hypothetical protein SELMODRAFT_420365 [Selaginella moellendorffii]
MKWAPCRSSDQLQQQPPGCKCCHTCNAVRNLIYIFGGCGRDECQTNDVHVFDFGMYTWSKPVMKGTHPSPWDSHSSTAIGSKLYVFGGTDGTSPLDDLFVLDTATNTLVMFLLREKDIARLSSVTTCSCLGDVRNPAIPQRRNTFVWKKISTTGVSPIPRDSHTCSSYKNCFVVMGGEDGGNAYLNDVHILDTGDSVNAERDILFFYGVCNEELEALDDMYFLDTEMLREKDPSEPKLSMRKERKRRRQEYRATPFVLDKQRDVDKSLVSSHREFQAHVQPLGEKMFEAREGKHHRRKPQDVQKAVPEQLLDDAYYAVKKLGEKHSRGSYNLWSLENGSVVALGSDWPVVAVNPVGGIRTVMERTPLGWSHPWIPKERISAWDAVAGYTPLAVYAAALEDLVGSLTQGKFANFVVLSESPFGQGTGIFPRVVAFVGGNIAFIS